MTTASTTTTGGSKVRVGVQRFGTFLSGMIMPNIPALIAWGIVTMFFIDVGFAPVPALATISPTSVVAGSPDTVVHLTGTDFGTNSVVRVNTTNLATTFISTTSLDATLPASLIHDANILSLVVFTPEPGGGTSGAMIMAPMNMCTYPSGLASGSAASAASLNWLMR